MNEEIPDEVVAWLKRHRAVIVIIPEGVEDEDVKALVRTTNKRLDELAAEVKRKKL